MSSHESERDSLVMASKTLSDNLGMHQNEEIAQEKVTPKQTLIRLKRRIDESPSKILVVSCKRVKTDILDDNIATSSEKATETVNQVLRLIGFVSNEEIGNKEAIGKVHNMLENATAKLETHENVYDYDKIKLQRNKNSKPFREISASDQNKFKIVNNKRCLESDNNEDNKSDNSSKKSKSMEEWTIDNEFLNLLELVPESESNTHKDAKPKIRPSGYKEGNITCNGVPMIKKSVATKGEDFVYDIYVTNDPHIEQVMKNSTLSVIEADEFDFVDYRDQMEDADYFDEDEDSNAEDNCRNDYPDSEEEGLRDDAYGCEDYYNSEDEDGLVSGKFTGLKLDDASSDDDDLIYGIDDDGASHGISFDKSYARYKKRLCEEYADEVVSVTSEEEFS